MAISGSAGNWLRLPSRVALLLGLGALSAAGARTDLAAAAQHPEAAAGIGDIVVRTDGERVYLSEGGNDFRELALDATARAQLLRQLSTSGHGATGIRLRPTIYAGSGGSGFHWDPVGGGTSGEGLGPAGGSAAKAPSGRKTKPADRPGAAKPAVVPTRKDG